jgi:very-short-patch-repair endonuclease
VTDVIAQAAMEWQCCLDTKLAKGAADVIARLTHAGAKNAAAFFECCETPIERQFAIGFFLLDGWLVEPTGSKSIRVQSPDRQWSFTVTPQSEFEDFRDSNHQLVGRVDFLLQCEVGTGVFYKLGVELDGHEWHEKSKDQARNDRERERALLADTALNALIRFTGSEVFRDPERAASGAINVLANQCETILCIVKRVKRDAGGAA